MNIALSIMEVDDFVEEMTSILKEYALSPGANQPFYHNLRANLLAEALRRFNVAESGTINARVPYTLDAARKA